MIKLFVFLIILVLLVALHYLLFVVLKLFYNNKTLRLLTMALIGSWVLYISINRLFFRKMEYIQSEVYPHLYLVKNRINQKDSLRKAIKEMAIQKVNKELVGNEEKYKTNFEFKGKRGVELSYAFSFYEYYKGWGSNPIGEAGTAHFIKNKEDPGGFSSELIEYYQEYQIAVFGADYCEGDSVNYMAVLNFAEDGYIVHRDTIINMCK